MHEGGFLQKLMEVAGGDRNKPIAIICATGGRTRYLQHALAGAGFTNIIDVSEGMDGLTRRPRLAQARLAGEAVRCAVMLASAQNRYRPAAGFAQAEAQGKTNA
jgi:hypothetical protein